MLFFSDFITFLLFFGLSDLSVLRQAEVSELRIVLLPSVPADLDRAVCGYRRSDISRISLTVRRPRVPFASEPPSVIKDSDGALVVRQGMNFAVEDEERGVARIQIPPLWLNHLLGCS